MKARDIYINESKECTTAWAAHVISNYPKDGFKHYREVLPDDKESIPESLTNLASMWLHSNGYYRRWKEVQFSELCSIWSGGYRKRTKGNLNTCQWH